MKQKLFGKKLALALLSLLCVFGMGHAVADSSLQAVQSYTASGQLQNGMIVKLTGAKGTDVAAAAQADATRMLGVLVPPGDAAVTLSSQSSSGSTVYVAASGRYEVLVSNQNGSVSPGDYVTISSLNGIGMKADSAESEVLGKAVGSFDGSHGIVGSTKVRNQAGKTVPVNFGRVTVDIAIAPNPLAIKITNLPGFLQRTGTLISNKPVQPWRIYLALTVMVMTTILAGGLLYAGVRNGMVAVGRNPLARTSIMGSLVQVVITSMLVFAMGLVAVYVLLKV